MSKDGTAARFLVVEDSVSARRIFQELLFRLGVSSPNLRMAASPDETLRIMAEWTPDLVFLDLELHPPDGSAPSGPGGKDSPSPSHFANGDALGRELVRRNP